MNKLLWVHIFIYWCVRVHLYILCVFFTLKKVGLRWGRRSQGLMQEHFHILILLPTLFRQIQQTLLTSQNDKHDECHLCIFWCTCIIGANYHKNAPTMPYKAALPVLHAPKRSFMKMASKIKTTNFTSWEIEFLPSEIHKRKRRRNCWYENVFDDGDRRKSRWKAASFRWTH